MSAGLRFPFRRGPMPSATPIVPAGEPIQLQTVAATSSVAADAEPAGSRVAVESARADGDQPPPSASLREATPSTTTPGVDPHRTPGTEAGPPDTTSSSLSAERIDAPPADSAALVREPDTDAPSQEAPAVVECRRRYERLRGEESTKRAELRELGETLARARVHSREAAIVAKLDGTPEAATAAKRAVELLTCAAEREATVGSELDVLRVAVQRAGAALEKAAADAARADEKIVRDGVLAPEALEKLNAELVAALDRLFLVNRLRGQVGTIQAMVGNALGLKLDGGALMARSSELFRRILAEQKAKGAP